MTQCTNVPAPRFHVVRYISLSLVVAVAGACSGEPAPDFSSDEAAATIAQSESSGLLGSIGSYELVSAIATTSSDQDASAATRFPSELTYDILGERRDLRLELSKNVNLFATSYTELHQNNVGGLVGAESSDPVDCYYQGSIYIDGKPDPHGRVAVSLCRGLSALIRTQGRLLRLVAAAPHVADAAQQDAILFVPGSTNADPERILPTAKHVSSAPALIPSTTSRDLLEPDTDPEPYDGVPSVLHLELVVVSDHRRFLQFGELGATKQAAAEVVNQVDAIYGANDLNPPLRIRIAKQVVFNVADPYEVEADEAGNLSHDYPLRDAFAAWASTALQDSDARHLITGYDPPTAGGVSYRFGICDPLEAAGYSFARSASNHNAELAFTIAHELGHNLGMGHDGQTPTLPPNHNYADTYVEFLDTSACPAGTTLMSSRPTGTGQTVISGCTRSQYHVFMTLGRPQSYGGYDPRPTCLDNVPAPSCVGEPGAECSPTQACCDNDCRLVPASAHQACRSQADPVCDVVEYCDGVSAECPADQGQHVSEACEDEFGGPGVCYASRCQSFALACAEHVPRSSWDRMMLIPCTLPGQEPTCAQLTCEYTNYPGRCLNKGQTPNGVPCGDDMQCFDGECLSGSIPPDDPHPTSWQVGPWGACSADCGEATRSREITCTQDNGVVVDDSECDPNSRPADIEACTLSPCDGDGGDGDGGGGGGGGDCSAAQPCLPLWLLLLVLKWKPPWFLNPSDDV